jgi:hypothetical protein
MKVPSSSSAKRPVGPTEVLLSPDGTEVFIGKGRAEQIYALAEFPTPWPGRAFTLTKADGEVYSVFLSLDLNAEPHRCDCAGHTFTGRCRHLDSLLALMDDGQLPDPREAMHTHLDRPRLPVGNFCCDDDAAHDNTASGSQFDPEAERAEWLEDQIGPGYRLTDDQREYFRESGDVPF